jgi:hypothetical protein
MKKIGLFIGLFLYSLNCLSAGCLVDFGEIVSWSGDCLNGNASGDGELILKNDNGELTKYVGKLKEGKRSGLFLAVPLSSNVAEKYAALSGAASIYMPLSTNHQLMFLTIPGKGAKYSETSWFEGSRAVSFQEAMDIIQNHNLLRQRVALGFESMEFKKWRDYLEGKISFEVVDDPTVAGIKLSLSDEGGSSVKPKKKSKKKN